MNFQLTLLRFSFVWSSLFGFSLQCNINAKEVYYIAKVFEKIEYFIK